ncbi:hypothetical protein PLICRDRAFT_338037 [Plicaturopsis crispa FD-325 SS-3]|uniref:Uncharacterized protein n=1 Tax=Plicaturopsis crispa FD-325 SS-3 TaxID=944288 RepID=A0A0C9TAF5_PLICR|nr:hypothetical protein PLICRDRAFT_338037 [Plicaturopsis crispa FD-325 SS-3]
MENLLNLRFVCDRRSSSNRLDCTGIGLGLFHRYLKSSLTQAKAERLIDAEVLGSAEGDLMITGPALCLYFAALRCTTSPPSVPLPRATKTSAPMELSESNCPPAFISFLRVWSQTVPRIQALTPEHQHDLARIICGLRPLAVPPAPSLSGIAADMRAVAIEISQRRSFQERLGDDLQAAIDAGQGTSGASGLKVKASFVPPPVYDPSPQSSPGSSPGSSHVRLPSHPSPVPSSSQLPPQSPTFLSPYGPRSPSPTILSAHSPAIEFIRETLYASLGDVLEATLTLRHMLTTDPPRAYFAAVALAILEVSTTSMTADGAVVGVLGKPFELEQCPPQLRPFMHELAGIGRQAKEVEEDDDRQAMELAQRGEEIPPPRMERVKKMLVQGVGYADGRREVEEGRRSVEGRAVAFTNRINGLALGMTRLKAFRERQNDVFKVLSGIGS